MKETHYHPCYLTDREWWSPLDRELLGDMGWTFETMPETLTRNADLARKRAVNCVVSDREESAEDNSLPVYLINRKDENGECTVTDVVTAVPASDGDFAREISTRYPDATVTYVPENQKLIELGDDESDAEFKELTDSLSEAVGQLVCKLDELCPDTKETMYFSPVHVGEFTVSGLTCHVGIDRRVYYNPVIDGNRSVGMTPERLESFFLSHLSESTLNELAAAADSCRVGLSFDTVTRCPDSDLAVAKIDGEGRMLIHADTMMPVGDRPHLYADIDIREHSGYRLVTTLPADGEPSRYNFIDRNGKELCTENLTFAKPFDDSGHAYVEKTTVSSFIIDDKGVVLEKGVKDKGDDSTKMKMTIRR